MASDTHNTVDTESMRDRIDAVQRRVAEACHDAGRSVDSVHVLAVSKKKPPEVIAEAAACGLRSFGENKVQEAASKIPLCPDGLAWHLVGHLQSNKVRMAVDLFGMIHSVDSLRIMTRINEAAEEVGKTMPVCLQVNVSGEASKFGLAPDAVPELLQASTGLMNIEVCGLMTMPPFSPNPEDTAPIFRDLRELRDQWRADFGIPLDDLSMGMSHDFEVAIAQGATWIRVGTALLGSRESGKPET